MKGKGKMIGAICALAVFLLAVACPGVLAATSAEEKPTVVLTTYGGSIEDDSFISLCWQGLQNSQGGATLGAAENTPAVSYTHLDVYKRQIQEWLAIMWGFLPFGLFLRW